MTRKHQSLVPLSHQHQHTLALAVIIRRRFGIEKGEAAWLEGMFALVQNAYHDELVGHFEVEESVLFPQMERRLGRLELVPELLDEHRGLHTLIQRLDTARTLAALDELPSLLEPHVHKEERRLFAEFESRMSPEDALQVGREIAARLKQLCPRR